MPNALPLTIAALARETGYSRTYIHGAINAGFYRTHGLRTTAKSFLDWVAAHPEFRLRDGFAKDKLRRPDLSAACKRARRGQASKASAPRAGLDGMPSVIMNEKLEAASQEHAPVKGDRRFKHPNDRHKRRPITLHPEVLRRADVLKRDRAISNFSGYLAALINEEWERRGLS